MTILCAANQISKSSTQIRTVIEWATNRELWSELWLREPKQFWYFYPNFSTAAVEVEKKWVPDFLPKGKYKESGDTSWKLHYARDKSLHSIAFGSGVSVFFKAYSQKESNLQSSTCDAVFCDEELPMVLYPELQMRLAATNGYFRMVFTATLGQEVWRCAMEERGTKMEKFPSAHKLQVSMFDCLEYEDGTTTPWSVERINEIIAQCSSPQEVQRRIYGRFVLDEGLLVPAFDRKKHAIPSHPLPSSWRYYAAVDYGSGGKTGHPAGIVFVAMNGAGTKGRVFRAWRGDGVETAASDVWEKYRELRGNLEITQQCYDPAAKDFEIVTSRLGESFTKAEKGRELGYSILNTLFKNDMLKIHEDDVECQKLMQELSSVTDTNQSGDDLLDSLRYCVVMMPWNWEAALKEKQVPEDSASLTDRPLPKILNEREQFRENMKRSTWNIEESGSVEDEFREYNDLYG